MSKQVMPEKCIGVLEMSAKRCAWGATVSSLFVILVSTVLSGLPIALADVAGRDSQVTSQATWAGFDQTYLVKDWNLYDYATDQWIPDNLIPLHDKKLRFASLNEEGGPLVPEAALEDPDLFTYHALQTLRNTPMRKIERARSEVLRAFLQNFVFPGAGQDEVKAMPVGMIRTLETYVQPGDLILQSNDPGDKNAKARSKFMHSMLYIGNGLVVHSIGVARETAYGWLDPGVFLSRWEDAFQRDVDGADRLVILRPRVMDQYDFNRIVEYAVAEVGKPYDFGLNTATRDRYYCTELAYHAYRTMKKPMDIRPEKGMPMGLITGPSYLDAMDRGEFDLIMVINPKTNSREILK